MLPENSLKEDTTSSFVSCMREGNAVYDASAVGCTGQYLSVYDSTYLMPCLLIEQNCDFGLRDYAACLQRLQHISALAAAANRPLGPIGGQYLLCISVVFLVDGSCYFSDSHCHEEERVLIIKCPTSAGWSVVADALVEVLGKIQDCHLAVVELAA